MVISNHSYHHKQNTMKQPKKLNRKMWAYFAPDGNVITKTISFTRSEARAELEVIYRINWEDAEVSGYACHRIDCHIEPLFTPAR